VPEASAKPFGDPVGRVGTVPGREVGAAVVAVLEHQQLGAAAGRGREPLGVLPRDEPVLAPENDQKRCAYRLGGSVQVQGRGDAVSLLFRAGT
jgi:hypothetical protein